MSKFASRMQAHDSLLANRLELCLQGMVIELPYPYEDLVELANLNIDGKSQLVHQILVFWEKSCQNTFPISRYLKVVRLALATGCSFGTAYVGPLSHIALAILAHTRSATASA